MASNFPIRAITRAERLDPAGIAGGFQKRLGVAGGMLTQPLERRLADASGRLVDRMRAAWTPMFSSASL